MDLMPEERRIQGWPSEERRMLWPVKYDPSRVTKRRKEEHQSETSLGLGSGVGRESVVVSHGIIRRGRVSCSGVCYGVIQREERGRK